MPKTADATLKSLVEFDPPGWLPFIGKPPAPVDVVDADISAITAAADKDLRVGSDPQWLLHLEMQAGRDIRRMRKRLDEEPAEADTVWAATFFLLGLRYPKDLALHLLRGVHSMKESTTYQAVLEEGMAEGAVQEVRKVLLLQGRQRFGPPDKAILTALEAIADLQRLELMAESLIQVASWQELLKVSPPQAGRTRRKKR